MKKRISAVVIIFILILSSLMIVAARYYATEYADQEFDQIVFYIFHGVSGTSQNVVSDIVKSNIKPIIILSLVLIMLAIKNTKKALYFTLRVKSKEIKMQLFPIKIVANHRFLYTIIVFIFAIITLIRGFKIDEYMKYRNETSKFFEEYYVEGSQIDITFPEKKRNLIFISMESMETTICSKENGGNWTYSIIPELEQLAIDDDNISFSNTDNLGGADVVFGTTFTSGGLVAETGGVPLLTPSIISKYTEINNDYYGNGKYLANLYTLGDILSKEGYNLEIMMGSDGEFGGRAQYFKTNGNYKVFDLNYAIETGKMKKEDTVWWGFNDDKLYEWSKEEITKLAKEEKPFNYILQTADTHFPDGWLSKNAENKFDSQYENVFAYSSKSVNDFINWIKKQDFYENTTIVILGDHLGMQSQFYKEHMVDELYSRRVYNVIINSAIKEKNSKNREFSTMDFFPTILASIGAKIEGDRIGLGTNLFSERKTLVEELGFEYIDIEVRKKSQFYNDVLLGEDYYLIREKVQKYEKEQEVEKEIQSEE